MVVGIHMDHFPKIWSRSRFWPIHMPKPKTLYQYFLGMWPE
jgi:hypothetical protein